MFALLLLRPIAGALVAGKPLMLLGTGAKACNLLPGLVVDNGAIARAG